MCHMGWQLNRESIPRVKPLGTPQNPEEMLFSGLCVVLANSLCAERNIKLLLPCWCLKGVCEFLCNSCAGNESFLHIDTKVCVSWEVLFELRRFLLKAVILPCNHYRASPARFPIACLQNELLLEQGQSPGPQSDPTVCPAALESWHTGTTSLLWAMPSLTLYPLGSGNY